MDANTIELRQAVSRLLSAVTAVDLEQLDEKARRELSAAREFAARILVKTRALEGRPWVAAPGASFYERWTVLKATTRVDGARSERAVRVDDGLEPPRSASPEDAP
jgi:hypothetical protein